MKKYILIILFLMGVHFSELFAQQIVSTKGDKVPVAALQTEPWRVENTANKATSNTQNIYQNGKVAVGNYNTKAITKQLEVEGNIKTQKLFVPGIDITNNTGTVSYANVGIDMTTGELVKLVNGTNVKPYSRIVYDVTTNTGEDWVKDLDTKIPANDYTVVLVNAILDPDVTVEADAVILRKPVSGYFGPLQFAANVVNGTWHLSADYLATPLNASKKYKWRLICMVIQNTQIKDLGTFSGTLDNTDSGQLGTPINGL